MEQDRQSADQHDAIAPEPPGESSSQHRCVEDDVGRPSHFETHAATPDARLCEVYLIAAELHLQRATSLAATEWTVSLSFWTAMLASAMSFIAFVNASSLPMAQFIAHSDFLFLFPYIVTAGLFLFTFSINQAESIVIERSRFRFCLNQAVKLRGGSFLLVEKGRGGAANQHLTADLQEIDPRSDPDVRNTNKVWASKVLTTFWIITVIWIASQWLAHGKIYTEEAARHAALQTAAKQARLEAARAAGARFTGPLLERYAREAEHDLAVAKPVVESGLQCAFLDCGDGKASVGWPELGTWLWLGTAAAVGLIVRRPFKHARR